MPLCYRRVERAAIAREETTCRRCAAAGRAGRAILTWRQCQSGGQRGRPLQRCASMQALAGVWACVINFWGLGPTAHRGPPTTSAQSKGVRTKCCAGQETEAPRTRGHPCTTKSSCLPGSGSQANSPSRATAASRATSSATVARTALPSWLAPCTCLLWRSSARPKRTSGSTGAASGGQTCWGHAKISRAKSCRRRTLAVLR
mmetsp:Transcript_66742/g.155041  ORF Transcript_66742/g.155041 Transcript_66742/m.155041 type:complete len:202 (+) Transcript_66742:1095-1700(+)